MSDQPEVTSVTSNKVPPPAERIVRPRTREYRHYPIIAICGEDTLDENGEVGTLHDLMANLPKMQPILFVTIGSGDLLARMDAIYSQWTPQTWQFRVSNHEREIVRPDGIRAASRVTLAIHYLGWKHGNYHKMIDPITMYGRRLDEIMPGGKSPIGKLLDWGITLRTFCEANGIEVRPTNGAISSQLLTDPRFYPEARRKVPACINESTREAMPGNHYDLRAFTDYDEYSAIYIDQSRAHHYHARTTHLPDANYLYAHGRFVDLESIVFTELPDQFYGLYCLDLECPNDVAFSWLPSGTLEKQFVWSNELPHLLDMGYMVTGIRACWGSRKQDKGLARYARWAETQLYEYDNAAWLKPLLLSAYGVLATKPRYAESVFKLAKTGIPTTIRTGRYKLNGICAVGTRKLEPRIANVLHRGMIEAATRSESVGLAQHLTGMGHRVLSIYADAVIVQLDEENPLPSLPEPWRIKETLNHLHFLNQQAFVSGEMTKIPGIHRELLKHTKRSHASRLINVAEEMEYDEL